MPVVCESFQESLNDRGLSRQPEGLQVEPQGLVNAKTLEGKCAAKTVYVIITTAQYISNKEGLIVIQYFQ